MAPSTIQSTINPKETTSSTLAENSTKFLGQSGEWWDAGLILSVVLGAIAATAIGITTAGSIIAHKREAKAAEDALEKFKLESQDRADAHEIALQKARSEASQIDANLLREQRLTSNERWRLGRIEKIILPRYEFIDWKALIEELHKFDVKPINLAVVDTSTEAFEFGYHLQEAFRNAGRLHSVISVKEPVGGLSFRSSSGSFIFTFDEEGLCLSRMLWQKFGIAGSSSPVKFLQRELPMIPRDRNCLFVSKQGEVVGPPGGQDGEGLDEYDRPVPP